MEKQSKIMDTIYKNNGNFFGNEKWQLILTDKMTILEINNETYNIQKKTY